MNTVAIEKEEMIRQITSSLSDIEIKKRLVSICLCCEKEHWLEQYIQGCQESIKEKSPWFDSPVFLNWYAHNFKPVSYLEVGVRRGRSIAQILVESPETIAYGFDMWIPNYGSIPEQGIHVSNPGPSFVIEELYKLGIRNLPALIVGNSHEKLPKFWANPHNLQQFEVINIDGDHTYEGAKLDLDIAFAHLAPGGVMLFDDINHPLHLYLKTLWDEYKLKFPDYLFIEDSHGVGTGVAFKPPFDKLYKHISSCKAQEESFREDICLSKDSSIEVSGKSKAESDSFDSKLIKVLYDISVLGQGQYDPRARTGVFRVIEYMAQGLAKSQEVELSFCAMLPGIFQSCQDYLNSNPLLKNITLHQSQLPETDIFHSSFYHLPNEITKPERFLTVVDIMPVKLPHFFNPNYSRLHHTILNTLKADDWVISISHYTKKDLCEYKGMDPERVFVAHLAADPKLFYQCNDPELISSVRKKYGIPDAPYILSLSTLDVRKNIDHVIRCFSRIVREENIRDLYLVLVGTKGWDHGKIFKEIDNNPLLKERIILTGFVHDSDLAALYSGALAFVYPSFYEGFGLPPLEAMQCGIPVITSNTSSLPEVVGDAGIMLAPDDAEEFCHAMLELYRKPSLRQTMSLKSLEQAKKFTWEKCIQETIAAYKTALSEKSSVSDKTAPQMRSVKILIDGVMFQIHKSGVTRVWESLFKEWADSGFSKHILVLDRAGTATKIAGIRYRAIPPYDYNNPDADRQMLQQICDAEQADLFVSTFYTTPISTPSVFIAHDMIPEIMGVAINSPMCRDKHYGILHASAYVAVSKNTAKDLNRFFPYIPMEHIVVAYNGVDQNMFSPASSEKIDDFRTGYKISKPYFLLVGDRMGFNGYKNTVLFFKAFQMLDNKHEMEIVCVGRAKLETEFASYVADSKVHVLPLNDDELRIAYSGAVALVYPSKYEGFGLPVLEAMACGCPIITCRNASIPEVAGDAAIYVSSDDLNELVEAMKFIQIPENRQSLTDAGLNQAKKFSWRKMAEKISATILSLVENFSSGKISVEPLYISRLKEKVANYRQNPSDQGAGADLRKERRKIAKTFLNTPREKIEDIYQTYVGDAYNLLLSSGLQENPPGSEDQSLFAKIVPEIQNDLTKSVLAGAYGSLMERNLPLSGNERGFITHVLSALQKREDVPHLLHFVLVALLFLEVEVKKG